MHIMNGSSLLKLGIVCVCVWGGGVSVQGTSYDTGWIHLPYRRCLYVVFRVYCLYFWVNAWFQTSWEPVTYLQKQTNFSFVSYVYCVSVAKDVPLLKLRGLHFKVSMLKTMWYGCIWNTGYMYFFLFSPDPQKGQRSGDLGPASGRHFQTPLFDYKRQVICEKWRFWKEC